MDHVRTQTPYALVCAGIAAGVGFIPAGFGVSPWLTLPMGLAVCVGVVFVVGRPVASIAETVSGGPGSRAGGGRGGTGRPSKPQAELHAKPQAEPQAELPSEPQAALHGRDTTRNSVPELSASATDATVRVTDVSVADGIPQPIPSPWDDD